MSDACSHGAVRRLDHPAPNDANPHGGVATTFVRALVLRRTPE